MKKRGHRWQVANRKAARKRVLRALERECGGAFQMAPRQGRNRRQWIGEVATSILPDVTPSRSAAEYSLDNGAVIAAMADPPETSFLQALAQFDPLRLVRHTLPPRFYNRVTTTTAPERAPEAMEPNV